MLQMSLKSATNCAVYNKVEKVEGKKNHHTREAGTRLVGLKNDFVI